MQVPPRQRPHGAADPPVGTERLGVPSLDVVNGKSTIEHVMERRSVTTDEKSGIVNDPNRYAVETMGDPACPLPLLRHVITVSRETMRIVDALPPLRLQEETRPEAAE